MEKKTQITKRILDVQYKIRDYITHGWSNKIRAAQIYWTILYDIILKVTIVR